MLCPCIGSDVFSTLRKPFVYPQIWERIPMFRYGRSRKLAQFENFWRCCRYVPDTVRFWRTKCLFLLRSVGEEADLRQGSNVPVWPYLQRSGEHLTSRNETAAFIPGTRTYGHLSALNNIVFEKCNFQNKTFKIENILYFEVCECASYLAVTVILHLCSILLISIRNQEKG